MKYLLDTHTVLWFAGNSTRLSQRAKQFILDKSAKKYVSIASTWELAIKMSLKKIKLDGGILEFFRMIDDNGFTIIPISKSHIQKVVELPFHHRDPFDRLLIASAICDNLCILTADENIALYKVKYEW